MDRMYYTRRLNSRNFINNSADFQTEHRYGMSGGINSKKSPGSLANARNESDLCLTQIDLQNPNHIWVNISKQIIKLDP